MELIANAIQTVTANSNVLFTDTIVHGSSSIYHREGSGLVTLRGLTNQCRARFKVSFNANIALPAGATVVATSLAIAIAGEAQGAATMIYTPAAAASYGNVSSSIFIDVPQGCCTTISVLNTSGVAINIQNANLIIERVA